MLARTTIGVALATVGIAAIAAPAAAQLGETTYANYESSIVEDVAGSTVTLTDDDLVGQTGTNTLVVGATNLVTTHGNHQLLITADVDTASSIAAGAARLRTFALQFYELGGTNALTDKWREDDARMLARATLVDDLTIGGVAGSSAELEFYWQVAGRNAYVVEVNGSPDYAFDTETTLRFQGLTTAPNSGGGVHNRTLGSSGVVDTADASDTRFIDDFVVHSFDVDPTTTFRYEMELETEQTNQLDNGIELTNLDATGQFRADFTDDINHAFAGAELVGVVVRDSGGTIQPSATVSSAEGYLYPVLAAVPDARTPAKNILSPVAVIASDLGEFGASTPFEQMIDQSNLDIPFVSGAESFDDYINQIPEPFADPTFTGNWQSLVDLSLPLEGFVDFDLGATYRIDRIALWYRSLQDIRILVADDPAGPFTEVSVHTGLPDKQSNVGSTRLELLDLGGEHDARYVRLEVDDVYPSLPGGTFGYAIVCEVAVSAEVLPDPIGGSVPVPGVAGAVVALGFTALGVGTLRRRSR